MRHLLQGGPDSLAGVGESLCNGLRKKFVLAPKVLVKPAHGQPRRLHYTGHARATQAFRAELTSGVPDDTIASSRFVFRFVTHIGSLDYRYNPKTQRFQSAASSTASAI